MKLANFWQEADKLRQILSELGYGKLSSQLGKLIGGIPAKLDWEIFTNELLISFIHNANLREHFEYSIDEINKIHNYFFNDHQKLIDKIFSDNSTIVFNGRLFNSLPISLTMQKPQDVTEFSFSELSTQVQKSAIVYFKSFEPDLEQFDFEKSVDIELLGFGRYGNENQIQFHQHAEFDIFRFYFDSFENLYWMINDEVNDLSATDLIHLYVDIVCYPLIKDEDSKLADVRLEFNIKTPIEYAEKFSVYVEDTEKKLQKLYKKTCDDVKEEYKIEIERQKEIFFNTNVSLAMEYFELHKNKFDIYGTLLT